MGPRSSSVFLTRPSFVGHCRSKYHTYSAEAVTDAELCCYPRGPFDAYLKTHPELARKIFEVTLRELESCRDWSFLLGRQSSYERVAGFLLMLATRIPNISAGKADRNGAHFQLPLTRAEIADFLGLTFETVKSSSQTWNISALRRIFRGSNRDMGACFDEPQRRPRQSTRPRSERPGNEPTAGHQAACDACFFRVSGVGIDEAPPALAVEGRPAAFQLGEPVGNGVKRRRMRPEAEVARIKAQCFRPGRAGFPGCSATTRRRRWGCRSTWSAPAEVVRIGPWKSCKSVRGRWRTRRRARRWSRGDGRQTDSRG